MEQSSVQVSTNQVIAEEVNASSIYSSIISRTPIFIDHSITNHKVGCIRIHVGQSDHKKRQKQEHFEHTIIVDQVAVQMEHYISGIS